MSSRGIDVNFFASIPTSGQVVYSDFDRYVLLREEMETEMLTYTYTLYDAATGSYADACVSKHIVESNALMQLEIFDALVTYIRNIEEN